MKLHVNSRKLQLLMSQIFRHIIDQYSAFRRYINDLYGYSQLQKLRFLARQRRINLDATIQALNEHPTSYAHKGLQTLIPSARIPSSTIIQPISFGKTHNYTKSPN